MAARRTNRGAVGDERHRMPAQEGLMTAIVHPSVDERSAQGKAAREHTAGGVACRMEARTPSPRPRRTARGAGRHSGARPRTHPPRPDVGLAVHLLSGRREDHGDGSQGHADGRTQRPTMRRCTPLELRWLRISRADSALRPERLRRDTPRAVRIRPEADGRELHDRGAQQRVQRIRVTNCDVRVGCRLSNTDGRVRRDAHHGRLVRTVV